MTETKEQAKAPSIDVPRCLRAMEHIRVTGTPGGRHHKIEEAIRAIQEDGGAALQKRFLGVKNYAGFGDQDCDCSYGMGPRHGHIVFRIGRNSSDATLGTDEVYLLECVRDFGYVEEDGGWNQPKKRLNLCDVLQKWAKAHKEAKRWREILESAHVNAHQEVA